MAIVEGQKITVKWGSRNKDWYEDKGYHYTKTGNEFSVDVKDLTNGTVLKVEYICDYCNGENQVSMKSKMKSYKDLIRYRKNVSKDCCNNKECTLKKKADSHYLLKPQTGESLKERYPLISSQWNWSKNSRNPEDYLSGSNKKVWWICPNNHEYEAKIFNRTISKTNCPYCANKKVCLENSLFTSNPKLTKEWHPILNGNLTPKDFTFGSDKKVWWQGACGHEWEAVIQDRSRGSGCPFCRCHKIDLSNCLQTTHPDLVPEWNVSKNKNLSMTEVSKGTARKVWWVCSKSHEWEASISSRTSKKRSSCPYCSGHKVCIDNCLATLNPELTREWHHTKNNTLTPFDVTNNSGKKVWWNCKEGHEWEATVYNRSGNNRACPICNESKGEKLIRKLLTSEKINFRSQYEFDDLKGLKGNNLRFDFAVLNEDDILVYLIEFDGEFHYRKMYDDDGHEMIVEHDKRKNIYCEKKDLPLLRIPYWESNEIEDKINEFHQNRMN